MNLHLHTCPECEHKFANATVSAAKPDPDAWVSIESGCPKCLQQIEMVDEGTITAQEAIDQRISVIF